MNGYKLSYRGQTAAWLSFGGHDSWHIDMTARSSDRFSYFTSQVLERSDGKCEVTYCASEVNVLPEPVGSDRFSVSGFVVLDSIDTVGAFFDALDMGIGGLFAVLASVGSVNAEDLHGECEEALDLLKTHSVAGSAPVVNLRSAWYRMGAEPVKTLQRVVLL